jgi:CBS domain-containing membrane protein
MFRIKDVMQRAVICTRSDMPIYDAIRLMARRNITSMPVVNADLEVIAMFTESDALRTVSGNEENETETVGDYMSPIYAALDPEANVVAASDHLASSHWRLCPVAMEGRLVGVVSRSDLVRGILRVKGQEATELS